MSATFLRMRSTKVVRILALGFTLVMALLGAAGFLALHQTHRIRESIAQLASDQFLITRLVNDVQFEENAMTEVLHQLAEFFPTRQDRDTLLLNLEESASELSRISQEAKLAVGDDVWRELETSVAAFTSEVRQILTGTEPVGRAQLEPLFENHNRVVTLVNELIKSSTERLAKAESDIELLSQELADDAAALLGSSFILAAACAGLTLTFAKKNIARIQWQSEELNRVSWHMLQSQEEVARRFSHELHDELGQSLAVIRTSISKGSSEDYESRRADWIHLVDQSINNVRELSQLLRPVILDDFGLSMSLQWLAEKFSVRTRIKVQYSSNCSERFADETETHLFRIAQEALTNVARHSEASEVVMSLTHQGNLLTLTIQDNGRGLKVNEPYEDNRTAFGLLGMRARATQSGGECTVSSIEPQGVCVRASVPAEQPSPK